MLNPPKIHFIGNATACAKWLPFAQKKMQYLMTVYQGAHFHKKFKVPGATIWLDNDGYIRRILIQAGVSGYEFATAFKHAGVVTTGTGPFEDYLFTRCKMSGGVVRPYKSTGGKINPDTETYENAKEIQVFGSTYDYLSNAGISTRADWFYVPQSLDMDELKEKGYRECSHMVTFNSFSTRHQDFFNRPKFYTSPPFFFGPAFLQNRGRKPKELIARVEHSDFVSGPPLTGATAVANGFSISASVNGYDFKFEVVHIASGTSLQFEVDKPSWVSGDQIANWYFSPDGKKAVSIQTNYIDKDNEIRQGICELKFTPSYENEVLTCDVEAGIEIYPDEGILPIAVDYDLYDASIVRALLVKNYLSEWLANPHEDNPLISLRGLLGVGEFVTIDSSGVISAAERKILLYHGPFLSGQPVSDPENYLILDEYGYAVFGTTNTDDAPGWNDKYQYHWLMTTIQALDMRAQACATTTCFKSLPSAGLAEDFYFYKEHHIWGSQKEASYYEDKAFPQLPPDLSEAGLAQGGFTEYNRDHPLWSNGSPSTWVLAWDVGWIGNSLMEASPHNPLTFKSFVFHFDDSPGSAGFAIHPNQSYALLAGHLARFRFEAAYTMGVARDSSIIYAPNGFNHDHIEFIAGNGEAITSTHVEQFNEARSTEYVHDNYFPALATNGTWIL